MKALTDFLDRHGIVYQRHDHPPVYTVEDVQRLVPPLPAARTKNLFFRDPKGRRHFLVVMADDKRVDIRKLAGVIGIKRMSFGSADRLKDHLGVDPGAVSLLALVNDGQHRVELFMDESLWETGAFQFHPLVNTATLVIEKEQVRRFLEATGHRLHLIAVPGAG